MFRVPAVISTVSVGLSLPELAEVMITLGCVEAMNLDGGGSSQLAVADQYISIPSPRSVPSIFAIVHKDSLNIPDAPEYEKIIDSGDPGVSVGGTGWFESANSGYFGATPSLLNTVGDGSNFYEFETELPKPGRE